MDAASDRNQVSELLRDMPAFLHLVRDGRHRVEADVLVARKNRLDETPGADQMSLLADIVSFSVRAGIGPLLALHEIPYPGERMAPETSSAEITGHRRWTLLGRKIGFPIGVPASNQTASSDWATFYAGMGYNVLTFRTVRSASQPKHPQPNLFFLPELRRPLVPGDDLPTLRIDKSASTKNLDLRAVTTAHSFGVPSPSPAQWQAEVERTVRGISGSQILIVAVLGTSKSGDLAELKEDFVRVAGMAEEAGAEAIELNLHCSLIYDSARHIMVPVCERPPATIEIVTAVRRALRPETRLVIKLGYLDEAERLEAIIVPLGSQRMFDAVSGINPVRAAVQANKDGTTVFVGRADDPTASRLQAGVSGVAIQKFGFTFVREVAYIRRLYDLDFEIIAMGGVMDVTDVSNYFALGADAVQSATASLFFTDLAVQAWHLLGPELGIGDLSAASAFAGSRASALVPDAEYELMCDPPVPVRSAHTMVTSIRRAPQELLMSREELKRLLEEDDDWG